MFPSMQIKSCFMCLGYTSFTIPFPINHPCYEAIATMFWPLEKSIGFQDLSIPILLLILANNILSHATRAHFLSFLDPP
jgi:hypothetical protein